MTGNDFYLIDERCKPLTSLYREEDLGFSSFNKLDKILISNLQRDGFYDISSKFLPFEHINPENSNEPTLVYKLSRQLTRSCVPTANFNIEQEPLLEERTLGLAEESKLDDSF